MKNNYSDDEKQTLIAELEHELNNEKELLLIREGGIKSYESMNKFGFPGGIKENCEKLISVISESKVKMNDLKIRIRKLKIVEILKDDKD